MRLISLNLQNFRQHRATEIAFPSGLTGILGANGSGKSTILEAIAWALYGNQAGVARGDTDSIIWRLAPGKSSALVELTFAFQGQTFTVRRSQTASKSNAEIQQDGRTISTSTKAVNERLSQLLGMTHTEFFNSYFTGQKDLNFLGAIKGAADRERFIAKMLGLERLTEAQGSAGKPGTLRDDRRSQENTVLKLEGSLGDWQQIQTNLTTHQTELMQAEAQLIEANTALESTVNQKQSLEPQLTKLEQERNTFNKLERDRQVQNANWERVQKQITELITKRSQLAADVSKYEALHLEVANYNELLSQYQSLTKLEQASTKRSELERTFNQRQTEFAEIQQQLDVLVTTNAALQEAQNLIATYQNQQQTLSGEITSQTQTWQEAQAELKAKIKNEQQNLKKLESQNQTITLAGIEGACPTCERPLETEYDTVIDRFASQILHLQGHLKEWQAELQTLNQPPEQLIALQAHQAQINSELQRTQKLYNQLTADAARQQLLQKSCDRLQAEIAKLSTEIAESPTGFDPVAYQQLTQQLKILKPKYEDYLRAADAPQRLQQAEQQILQLNTEQVQLAQTINDISQAIANLNFSETAYQQLREAIAKSTEQVDRAKNNQSQALQTVALCHQAFQSAQSAVTEYQLKSENYQIAKRKLGLLDELDNSFTAMRQSFTEKIRPELADTASLFLTQLTDGRYNAIEIDPKYNVVVLDDGDRKPVISGGEEDIVNLCLRLAISQMITERSGLPFSLLILDEVFGSLDDGRRDNVISLLHGLEQQFEQVLIITHLESLKENLNHSIRLEFDPREKCSRRII